MSSEEKSTALMLGVLAAVYGWYFVVVGRRLGDLPVNEISYRGPMLATVIAVIVLAVIGHTLLAVTSPKAAGRSDERDRIIDLRGEWIGGFVLGTGNVAGLLLAMAEVEFFWIANVLLAGLVLSEVVTSVAKLVLYRRMA